MPEVTYADPTTTRTPLYFDVLPPIQQASPITTTTPTRQPFNVNQDAPGQLARPIDYHAQPQTMPSVQEQIKRDGATWKTIDVTPETTASPSPSPRQTGGNLGIDMAMQSGSERLSAEIANELVWYSAGFLNGFFPTTENSLKDAWGTPAQHDFAIAGQKTGEKLRDTWDNRPQFEIPTIKIPKFEIPGLPDIFKPKPKPQPQPDPREKPIPGQLEPTVEEPKPRPEPEPKEKDIPRIRERKPKPVPNDLTRQLKELDLSDCGFVSFRYVRAAMVTGVRGVSNPDGSYTEYRILEPASIEEVYATAIKYNLEEGQTAPTLEEFIEGGGGSGFGGNYRLEGTDTYYTTYDGVGGEINSNSFTGHYPFNDVYYPFYSYGFFTVAVYGNDIGGVLNVIEGNSNITGKVYKINVSNPSAEDCPIGKPPPPPDPPPPPPEDCDCAMTCCPEIDYRKIQKIIEEEVKKLDVTAALPLSWQIRHEGDKPQMVIQCAEKKSAASGNEAAKYDSAKYPITVPHWKGGQNDKPAIPPYTKGNWEGILVLKDNSKVTINARTESECKKVLNAIKPWIKSDMLQGSYFKGGLIVTEEPIKQILVFARYGRYFGKGQKNNKPDWRVDFS